MEIQLRRWVKRSLIDLYKTIKLYKYYSFSVTRASNHERLLIYMADGKILHGGLGDRLCGIISAYNYCLSHNLTFKCYFVYPYSLNEILLPNKYDWQIDKCELSYHLLDACPQYLSIFSRNNDVNKWYFEKIMKLRSKRQIHFYSNTRYFREEDFGELFSQLFKPSKRLQKLLDNNLKRIGNSYISLTFRFQQLLGDFKEGNFPVIESLDMRTKLIKRCISCIKYLHSFNKEKILVTSDSKTFLDNANKLEYVYVIPGELRHMDFCPTESNTPTDADLKSYVDMFMLANAKTLYLCNINPLFHSGFPKTAAMIYNRPYHEITVEELRKYGYYKEF